MIEVAWHSQSFPPEGASAAEGIRNQLGRPELDMLTILVREAAQNSWDARTSDTEPVQFDISLRDIGPAQLPAWRAALQPHIPPDSDGFPLRARLRDSALRVLEVSDRGTKGLGGPTRADAVTEGPRDFVTFVRNIGEPRDRHLGGGTYGFGKGIFYLLSMVGTVLIHTRAHNAEGELETRLIGCALRRSYTWIDAGSGLPCRYTGRHWWGVPGENSLVEPLVGEDAEDMAARLGMKGFAAEETGTTVVVIDPNVSGMDPADLGRYLAETICWQLWPKMLARADGSVPMEFRVCSDGIDYEVPDPRKFRPLNLFVKAYEAMAGDAGEELWCGNPKRLLGRIGVAKRPMVGLEPTRASETVDIENMVHHVCLMRPAELVVTYHKGPKPQSENFGYAGVFRADEDLDQVFAAAEPPTHDAWHPSMLEKPDSTYVRTTFTRISEILNRRFGESTVVVPSRNTFSLAAASSVFADLMPGAWGTGGASIRVEEDGPRRGPGSSRGAGTRAKVTYVGEPYLTERCGETVLAQEFTVPVLGLQSVSVRVDILIAREGAGRENVPPINARVPELIGWQDPDGVFVPADTPMTQGGEGVWKVFVRPVPDTVTDLDLSAAMVGPA
ncbi:hypothetical protein [Kocuria rosea]|uniref:hypothetical protein n=1 Tax=Kocuria rosea TaxID=1275 RepID=UPI002B2428AD|nr:hypothetical protein [Kocuria rosea]MEB2527400.1 hypothetical protein [Kocuria rosea]MEB2617547.1 hypothetical protein [Kocuria rosea]